MSKKLELATFGAGCFWEPEEVYRKVKGVISTKVGFMGGSMENPSYDDVCWKNTGHVEVVQLEYDSAVVSYEKLLEIYWKLHNPTTLHRQGLNIGLQYQPKIFFHTTEQFNAARKSKEDLQKLEKYKNKGIVTEIVPATVFFKAEEYHQKYLMKRHQKTC